MTPNYFPMQHWVDWRQTQERDLAEHPVRNGSIEAVLSRSMLVAHLLVGDNRQAENVVMEAIDVWESNDEDGEGLFQSTLRAAAQRPIALFSAASSKDGATDWKLPVELRRVLKLPHELRLSFVLQVLIGLPSQVCAQMLGLRVHDVSEYTCAAIERLSILDH